MIEFGESPVRSFVLTWFAPLAGKMRSSPEAGSRLVFQFVFPATLVLQLALTSPVQVRVAGAVRSSRRNRFGRARRDRGVRRIFVHNPTGSDGRVQPGSGSR